MQTSATGQPNPHPTAAHGGRSSAQSGGKPHNSSSVLPRSVLISCVSTNGWVVVGDLPGPPPRRTQQQPRCAPRAPSYVSNGGGGRHRCDAAAGGSASPAARRIPSPRRPARPACAAGQSHGGLSTTGGGGVTAGGGVLLGFLELLWAPNSSEPSRGRCLWRVEGVGMVPPGEEKAAGGPHGGLPVFEGSV